MKKEVLLNILEITKKQQEAIQNKDIEAFNQLVDERQVEITKIDGIHRKYPETKEDKQEELLQEIMRLDTLNRQAYEAEFEEVKNKLNQMRAKKRAEQTYMNRYSSVSEEGIFFDKGR